jgi:hypothetical protein
MFKTTINNVYIYNLIDIVILINKIIKIYKKQCKEHKHKYVVILEYNINLKYIQMDYMIEYNK